MYQTILMAELFGQYYVFLLYIRLRDIISMLLMASHFGSFHHKQK